MTNTRVRAMATCPHPDRPAKGFGLCTECYRHLFYLNDREKEIERAKQYQREHPVETRAHRKKWLDAHPEYPARHNAQRRAKRAKDNEGRSPLFDSFQHWQRGKGYALRGKLLILAFEAFEAGYRRGIARELTREGEAMV